MKKTEIEIDYQLIQGVCVAKTCFENEPYMANGESWDEARAMLIGKIQMIKTQPKSETVEIA